MAEEVKPTPVEVISPVPIPVKVVDPGATVTAPPEVKQPSQTTFEQDRLTASQRRVNLIWEGTQAVIALIVVCTVMYVAATLALRNHEPTDVAAKAAAITAFLLLSNVVFLILGFYYGRVNHQNVGGVGPKDPGQTRGL